MAFWSGIPLVVAFSSFATVAVVSSRPLTSDLIFPAISLFMLLQFPLEMVRYLSTGILFSFSLDFLQVSLVTSNIIEAVVSIKRLSSFLNSEELQMYRTVVETPTLQFGDEVSVCFCLWEVCNFKPCPPGIIDQGRRFFVVERWVRGYPWRNQSFCKERRTFRDLWSSWSRKGIVYYHKYMNLPDLLPALPPQSSLLSAILGDMHCNEGEVAVRGSIAYAHQHPW